MGLIHFYLKDGGISMLQLKISHVYNPENQSSEQLIENFVVRSKQYKKILNEVIDINLNVSPQHFLIEGQRGAGKTTLLLRLQYEIQQHKDQNKYVVIRLPEEQYGIFTLFHLWQAVVDELEEIDIFKGISNKFDSYTENDEQSDGFEIINNHLIKNKKRLVLLIDNIGDLFNRFPEVELSRLRDIFHTSNYIQLIGASATTLEYTFKHDKPFFEFFKRVKLLGLGSKETIILLKQLARSYNKSDHIDKIIKTQPQRIEILRRMTGGVPRTIVLLFEILIENNNGVFEDLEAILDKVTPLYKHRMDDLPTQQQSIVNAMALNWDGISSKEIVTSLQSKKFTTKKVSAQLKELEKQQIVEGKLVNKKDKIYFIKERFFNIWYLMRYGRKKNRQRVLWLIRFLEQWCEPEEIKQRALLHLANIKSGKINPKTAFYQAEALSAILDNELSLQNKVLETTGKYLTNKDNGLAKDLSISDLEVLKEKAKNNELEALNKLGNYYRVDILDFENAEESYLRVIELTKNLDLKSLNIEQTKVNQLFNKALKGKSVHHVNKDKFTEFSQLIEYKVASMYLGELYRTSLNRYNEAISIYMRLVNLYSENTYDYIYVSALEDLGDIYMYKLNMHKEAMKYFNKAIDADSKSKKVFVSLSLLYFVKNIQMENALVYAKNANDGKENEVTLLLLSLVQLWNDNYKDSYDSILKLYTKYMDKIDDVSISSSISTYFMLLLAKDQYHIALELFDRFPVFKDKIKPIYYALMKLIKNDYPKGYLKMGRELEITVNEVLEGVKVFAERYN